MAFYATPTGHSAIKKTNAIKNVMESDKKFFNK